MKKKLVLLVMLVSFLALSLTFLSCGEDEGLKLKGTSWVYGMTKAEIAAESGITEAYLDMALAALGITINWPLPVAKIDFPSDNGFTMSQNEGISSFSSTPVWSVAVTGTYTISGNDVTLNVGGETQTATVRGRTLTITDDDEGTTMRFQKQ